MSMSQNLREQSGRVALVIGGSGGIGAAISVELAYRGARVAVGYARGAERAERIVNEIAAAGGEARGVHADVRSESACRELVEAVERMWGRLDILVYAAGVDLWGLALDTTPTEWRNVLDINLQGAFFAAQAAIPKMMAHGWGRIVLVGSIWGEVGAALEVPYSAAKAGLSGLTRALAKEMARSGITVNSVAPGVIDTAMNDRFDDEEKAALLARIPVGRLGTGRDVAHAVRFLTSEDAAYVTGHVLWVTGGFDPLP